MNWIAKQIPKNLRKKAKRGSHSPQLKKTRRSGPGSNKISSFAGLSSGLHTIQKSLPKFSHRMFGLGGKKGYKTLRKGSIDLDFDEEESPRLSLREPSRDSIGRGSLEKATRAN